METEVNYTQVMNTSKPVHWSLHGPYCAEDDGGNTASLHETGLLVL